MDMWKIFGVCSFCALNLLHLIAWSRSFPPFIFNYQTLRKSMIVFFFSSLLALIPYDPSQLHYECVLHWKAKF